MHFKIRALEIFRTWVRKSVLTRGLGSEKAFRRVDWVPKKGPTNLIPELRRKNCPEGLLQPTRSATSSASLLYWFFQRFLQQLEKFGTGLNTHPPELGNHHNREREDKYEGDQGTDPDQPLFVHWDLLCG